jgi:hypothetical protein
MLIKLSKIAGYILGFGIVYLICGLFVGMDTMWRILGGIIGYGIGIGLIVLMVGAFWGLLKWSSDYPKR